MSYSCPEVVNPVRPTFDHFKPEPVMQVPAMMERREFKTRYHKAKDASL